MGGAHLYCAALSCTAHRRPPMDQRGTARAGFQQGTVASERKLRPRLVYRGERLAET